MANPHYSNTTTLTSGTVAKAADVESKFDAVETGFDALHQTGTLLDLDVDSGVLSVDATNDRVAVNQGTPSADLHIGDDSAGTEDTVVRIEGGDTSGSSSLTLDSSTGGTSGTTLKNAGSGASAVLTLTRNNEEVMQATSSDIIFNDGGLSRSFRVESLAGEYGLYMVGSTGLIGMGQSVPTTALHIGDDSAGTEATSLRIEGGLTSGESNLILDSRDAGTTGTILRATGSGATSSFTLKRNAELVMGANSTETVMGDFPDDRDFRVEWSGGNYAIFMDGATGRTGINQSAPTANLHVGDDSAGTEDNSLRIEGGDTSGSSSIILDTSVGGTTGTKIESAGSGASAVFTIDLNNEEIIRTDEYGTVFNRQQNTSFFQVKTPTDDAALYISDSSGNTGIKQGSPTADLHVGDDSAGTEDTVLRVEGGLTTGSASLLLDTRNGSAAGTELKHLGNGGGSSFGIDINNVDIVTMNTAGVQFFATGTEERDFKISTRLSATGFMVRHYSGNVAIGQNTPSATLHIGDDSAGTEDTTLRVEGGITSGSSSLILDTSTAGTTGSILKNVGSGASAVCTLDVNNTTLIHASGTTVGINTSTPSALAALDVNGKIYQRGGEIHADYVFEPDYEIPRIEDYAADMMTKKRLPSMPESIRENGQDVVDMGASHKGMMEALELAHLFIADLQKRIDLLEKERS